MRKLLLLVAAVMMTNGVAKAAEMKIGYVDLQKAIQSTDAGKKAKKELEKEFNEKKKELQAKEEDLKKQGQELEKKSMVLSEEVRNQKQAEFQQEMMKYRELVGKSQQSIQKKEQDLTQPILDKISKSVTEYAEKNGYTMIIEKTAQNVLFAKKEVDLTDEIVKMIDKK